MNPDKLKEILGQLEEDEVWFLLAALYWCDEQMGKFLCKSEVKMGNALGSALGAEEDIFKYFLERTV